MSSPESTSSIMPSVLRLVTQHKNSMPITPKTDDYEYDYYVDKFLPLAPVEGDIDGLNEKPQQVGRVAILSATSADRTEETRVHLSLLGECSPRIPMQPIDPDIPESELVREIGRLQMNFETFHKTNPYPSGTGPVSAHNLAIAASILDDERTVLTFFSAGETCTRRDCHTHFSESRQMRILGQLGLINHYERSILSQSYRKYMSLNRTVLTRQQSAAFGTFLQRLYTGLEDIH